MEFRIVPAKDKKTSFEWGRIDGPDWTEEDELVLWNLNYHHKSNLGANFAVLTGERSGIIVIDLDIGKKRADGGKEADGKDIFIMWGGNLMEGCIVETPSGGYHIYYKWKDIYSTIASSNGRIHPSIDVKGNGGIIMKEGNTYTVRMCGKVKRFETDGKEEYKVINHKCGKGNDDCLFKGKKYKLIMGSFTNIPEMPDWLEKRLLAQPAKYIPQPGIVIDSNPTIPGDELIEILDSIPETAWESHDDCRDLIWAIKSETDDINIAHDYCSSANNYDEQWVDKIFDNGKPINGKAMLMSVTKRTMSLDEYNSLWNQEIKSREVPKLMMAKKVQIVYEKEDPQERVKQYVKEQKKANDKKEKLAEKKKEETQKQMEARGLALAWELRPEKKISDDFNHVYFGPECQGQFIDGTDHDSAVRYAVQTIAYITNPKTLWMKKTADGLVFLNNIEMKTNTAGIVTKKMGKYRNKKWVDYTLWDTLSVIREGICYDRITFSPYNHLGQYGPDKCGDYDLNYFNGFKVKYDPHFKVDKKKIKMLLDIIKFTLSEEDPIRIAWNTSWFARIVQRPFEKVGIKPLFSGVGGTGKSTIVEFFGTYILGPDYFKVARDADEVLGKFNGDNYKCILIYMNELSLFGHDLRKLKGLMDCKTSQFEDKFMSRLKLLNYNNYFQDENEASTVIASKIDNDTRRDCLQSSGDKLREDPRLISFNIKIIDDVDYQVDVAKHFYHYLCQYDTSGFKKTRDSIPETQYSIDLKEQNLPSIVKFLLDCYRMNKLNPVEMREYKEKDLVTIPVEGNYLELSCKGLFPLSDRELNYDINLIYDMAKVWDDLQPKKRYVPDGWTLNKTSKFLTRQKIVSKRIKRDKTNYSVRILSVPIVEALLVSFMNVKNVDLLTKE